MLFLIWKRPLKPAAGTFVGHMTQRAEESGGQYTSPMFAGDIHNLMPELSRGVGGDSKFHDGFAITFERTTDGMRLAVGLTSKFAQVMIRTADEEIGMKLLKEGFPKLFDMQPTCIYRQKVKKDTYAIYALDNDPAKIIAGLKANDDVEILEGGI